MQFKAKSEKQIQEESLLPKGEYDFEVVEAAPAKGGPTSKNPGMEFIKIRVRVFTDDGFRLVNGVLHPKMEAQLRHFCEACGLMDKYEAETLAHDDCLGCVGRLKLRLKDAEGNWPAKNEIADFIVPKPKVADMPKSEPVDSNKEDDSVPF